jgi:hypothetical protein
MATDVSEDARIEPKHIGGSVSRRVRNALHTLYWAWPLFAFLLPLIFIVQHSFVRFRVSRDTDDDLRLWASRLSQELRFTDHWELKEFRQSVIDVPNWTIISRDGTLIDIDGFFPSLVGPIQGLPTAIYERPGSVRSDLGDSWRLFARRLKGGSVILGVLESEAPCGNADSMLTSSAEQFGSTLDDALHVSSKGLNGVIEVAIIDEAGKLLNAWGGLPLKTYPIPERDMAPHFETMDWNGGEFRLFHFPILSPGNKPVGVAVIRKDTTGQNNTLWQHALVSVVLAVLAIILGLFVILRHQRFTRLVRLSVQEAIAIGESDTVEFKASFQYDIVKGGRAVFLKKEAFDTVAAFLNSKRGGGQLFIGVKDDGTVCGIEGDLSLVNGSRDQFELLLNDTLADKIGRAFAPLWRTSFETVGEKVVAVIDVEPSNTPAYVKGERGAEFFLRVGNSSRLYDTRETHEYLERNRRWFR